MPALLQVTPHVQPYFASSGVHAIHAIGYPTADEHPKLDNKPIEQFSRNPAEAAVHVQ
jgi:hypothetical protein